jgi:hypothetical protein
MKQKIIIVLLSIIMGFSFAQAEEAETLEQETATVTPSEVQETATVTPREVQQTKRVENRERISDFSQKMEQRKKEIEERRVETQQKVEERRASVPAEIEQRKEAFQLKIQEVKDEARRKRVQVLAQNIEKINSNLCHRYQGYLDALDLVLDKMEARTAKISENKEIEDVLIYEKIDSARDSINESREMIINQKARLYLIEEISEETIKDDFRGIMNSLKQDHEYLRREFMLPLRTMLMEIFSNLREGPLEE